MSLIIANCRISGNQTPIKSLPQSATQTVLKSRKDELKDLKEIQNVFKIGQKRLSVLLSKPLKVAYKYSMFV